MSFQAFLTSMARVSLTKPDAWLALIDILGLDAAVENQRKLQQAQEASCHDARRIAALEREVAYLRAPPYYRNAETQTSPYLERPIDVASRQITETRRLSIDLTPRTFADIDEYERVKGELPGVRQYVQKLQNARVALEEKNREQKAQLRQWAEYQKRWVLKYGPLDETHQTERERTIDVHTENVRAPSVPVPKSPAAYKTAEASAHSRVATDNNSNLSSPAVDISPSALAPAVKTGEKPVSTATNQHSVPGSLNDSADNDLTQMSSGDENGHKSSAYRHQAMQIVNPRFHERSGESGNAAVASVQTSRRKRKREHFDSPSVKHLGSSRDNGALGTASKPVQIKSDPCSSSPPIAFMSRLLDENHDSVDLDEVGSKTKTPKKLQRFMVEQAMLPQPDNEQVDDLLLDQYDEDNRGSPFENSIEPFLHDEPSSKGNCEELAIKPEREEQERHTIPEKAQRRQSAIMGRGTMVDRVPRQDVDTDGDMANERPQMRDRQVDDFNRRIEEAQPKNVRDKSKPETPKSYDRLTSLRRDFGTETTNFGLPTPTTVVRQPEAQRGPHSEESMKRGHPINPSVLRPTDPNNQILPRTSDQLDKEKSHCPPSRRDRGAAQIHTVLEDGEETPRSRKFKKQKRNSIAEQGMADLTKAKGQEHSDAHHRLGSLLAKPSLERPSLPSERRSVPQRASKRDSRTPPSNLEPGALLSKTLISTDISRYKSTISNTTPSMSKNKRPATYAKKPALPVLATLDLTSSDDPPPVIPEDEPLRSRPVQRLRREDFKINPAANHGFSHAYREVVRKRTERKCLPNCNRPDCCGDTIKKMLAIGGPLMQRQPGLFESSPPDDDDGDVGYDYNILKEYMGDNYRSWNNLSRNEKQAEWARAQQWSFGKKFGKHKAIERQRTPPGFWNNDIDSTQDLKQQRDEGERIAREEVEERWREAMRPEGLWKFADE